MEIENNKKKKLKLRERVLAYVVERQRPRLILPVILSIVLIAALIVCSYLDAPIKATGDVAHSDASDNVARISFAGDIVMGRNVQRRADEIGYDAIFGSIQQLWKDSDYVISNLDTCVIESDVSDYNDAALDKDVLFSTDKSNLKYLKEAGIDVLSIATDHIADYGRPTIKNAIDELDAIGIAHIGAGETREIAGTYQLLTIPTTNNDEITIAVFGALGHQSSDYGAKSQRVSAPTWDMASSDSATASNSYPDGVQAISSDVAASGAAGSDSAEEYDPWQVTAGTFSGRNANLPMSIADARTLCDVVVVYIHWGDDKMFYETDDMRALAQTYIDAGADVVIGTNPRVLLPIETYKRGIILYSIGSLVYDDAETRACDSASVDVVVDTDLNRTLEITPLRIKSCVPSVTKNNFYVNRMMTTLTKKLDKSAFSIEDGKLTISLGQKLQRR